MKAAAARTSLGLSVLFLVVYAGSNWITSRRSDVGTWCFAWEHHLPFVPWMVLPYMSIDLFFLAAPFLCRDLVELRTLRRRLALATVSAGGCFLLFPLRLAFERPPVSGWLGAIFGPFREVDLPFNLFPSLHITFCSILVHFYAGRSRGLVRAGLLLWFGLVGASTLLTRQHHVVDVVGGGVLAALCFYVFPGSLEEAPPASNRRVGARYAVGAAGAMAAALLTWPWGSLLLWPAFALSVVAAGYWGVGPRVFRKAGGSLPFSSRLLLAPVLLGHTISFFHYRRQCGPWDEVVPGVLLGSRPGRREAERLAEGGVRAVLDLTAESSEPRRLLSLEYLNLPVLDLTAPTQRQLEEAVRFIGVHSASGPVFVHCKAGYSRGAAAVGAFLLASGRARSLEDALAMLRKARPRMVVRQEVRQALEDFGRTLACAVNPALARRLSRCKGMPREVAWPLSDA